MNKLIENIVRNYIRKKMNERNLKDVFAIIQEEYTRVYHEDNIPTRMDYLGELITDTIPDAKSFGYSLTLTKDNTNA